MTESIFYTSDGLPVPAVSADEMRKIDRVAIEDVGLELLQMMENAGRNLASRILDGDPDSVTVLAGNGGNGGGGLACARHLENRDVAVTVVLDRSPDSLDGAAAMQYRILDAMGVELDISDVPTVRLETDAIVDALIGYGLRGAPRGRTRELIDRCNEADAPITSLDVPSGLDATSGDHLGSVITPNQTVTLALPKTGLRETKSPIYLADIGIPSAVYKAVGIDYEVPFQGSCWVRPIISMPG